MIVIGLIYLISLFACGIYFGRFALNPVLVATKGKKSKLRFYTSDFFSLTLVLSFPAVFVSKFSGFTLLVIVVAIAVFLVAIWSWVRGAVKLSSIGVSSPIKRFLFLGVVLPVVVMSIGFAIPWTLVLLMSSMNWGFKENLVMLVFALTGVPLVAICCRQICTWVVDTSDEHGNDFCADTETDDDARIDSEDSP